MGSTSMMMTLEVLQVPRPFGFPSAFAAAVAVAISFSPMPLSSSNLGPEPPLQIRQSSSDDARGDRVREVGGAEAQPRDTSLLLLVCRCPRRRRRSRFCERSGGVELGPPAVRGQGVLEARVA